MTDGAETRQIELVKNVVRSHIDCEHDCEQVEVCRTQGWFGPSDELSVTLTFKNSGGEAEIVVTSSSEGHWRVQKGPVELESVIADALSDSNDLNSDTRPDIRDEVLDFLSERWSSANWRLDRAGIQTSEDFSLSSDLHLSARIKHDTMHFRWEVEIHGVGQRHPLGACRALNWEEAIIKAMHRSLQKLENVAQSSMDTLESLYRDMM